MRAQGQGVQSLGTRGGSASTAVLEAPAAHTGLAERHPLKLAYGAGRVARGAESGPMRGESGTNLLTREFAAGVMKEPAFELRNEIGSLRTMGESLLQRTAGTGQRADLPEALAKLYTQLIEQQVSDEIAYRVVDDVKAELGPEQVGIHAMFDELPVDEAPVHQDVLRPAREQRPLPD